MFKRSSSTLLSGLVVAALLMALVAAEDDGKSAIPASTRVINGDIIDISEAPYMVQLRDNGFTFCGGALISSQHILTAAHCVVDADSLAKTVIVAGASRRNQNGVERRLSNIFVHPQYNRATHNSDVAILKLERPIDEAANIKILSNLCGGTPPVGQYLTVTGWGLKTKLANPNAATYEDLSQELRKVRLPVISNEDCERRNQGVRLGNTMMCAFDPQRAHNSGDSGGPVLYGNQICGIVSWSMKSATTWYPGVYTNVATVLPFIQEKLRL